MQTFCVVLSYDESYQQLPAVYDLKCISALIHFLNAWISIFTSQRFAEWWFIVILKAVMCVDSKADQKIPFMTRVTGFFTYSRWYWCNSCFHSPSCVWVSDIIVVGFVQRYGHRFFIFVIIPYGICRLDGSREYSCGFCTYLFTAGWRYDFILLYSMWNICYVSFFITLRVLWKTVSSEEIGQDSGSILGPLSCTETRPFRIPMYTVKVTWSSGF